MTRSDVCVFDGPVAAALLMLPNLSVGRLIGDPRSDHLPYPVVTDPESPHVWPGTRAARCATNGDDPPTTVRIERSTCTSAPPCSVGPIGMWTRHC